jgi:hypothetical protein
VDRNRSLLLGAVNAQVPIEVKNERGWPKDAARLSTRLKRVSPALRRVGVEVELPTGRAGGPCYHPAVAG